MTKISNKKLAELRAYYLEGGDTDPENVIEHFGFVDEAELEVYLEGLRQKFPDDFPAPEEAAAEEYTYFLRTDFGLLQELELVKDKNGTFIFAVKEVKEIVKIILKGKTVTLDLTKLRTLPATATEHGLPVARLIELAEIAKA